MLSHHAAVILLVAILAVSVSALYGPDWKPPRPRKCSRPGEVWKTCVMHGCAEDTCEKKEKHCISTCEFGCYCADGFFRDQRGRCVRSCNSRANSKRENSPFESKPVDQLPFNVDGDPFPEEEPYSNIVPHPGPPSRYRHQRRPLRRPKPKRETEWYLEDMDE